MITVAVFVRAMTLLHLDPTRMWGCAFAKQLENGTYLFVRLSESRELVDIVILGCEVSLLHGELVDRALLRVAQLLRTDKSTMMHLCPKCCSSDMFVRAGFAHAFYINQAEDTASGHALRCSRMHEVSAAEVRDGLRVGKIGGNSEPALYPSNSAFRDELPWETVTATGLARSPDGSGEVLPGSFFVLTHQLQEGCILSPECVTAIDEAVASGATNCRVTARGGNLELQLKFCVGDFIGRRHGSVIGGRTIRSIIACTAGVEIENVEASSGIVTVSENELCILATDDEVMLLVSNDYNGKPLDGVACRIAEVVSPQRIRLVRCHATDGPLPRLMGVTLMPLLRSFTVSDHVVVIYEPIPWGDEVWQPPLDIFPGSNGRHTQIIRLSLSNCSSSVATETCWREVKDHWSIMLGSEIKNYDITGMTIFRNPQRERLFLDEAMELKRLAKLRGPLLQLQQHTMRHFRDFAQKFGLLTAAENLDMNLSVAWLNKGKRFYYSVAQNGVLKLPRFFMCDAAMSHDGLKFTRYPRYSEYYSSGFSLSDRMVEQSDMLMCFTLLGRPQADVHMSNHSGIRSSGCPDSCYTNLKKDSFQRETFVQCPSHKQPDYDEISLFKPQRILPAAYLTFQRRRKTLLWLDSKPDAPDNVHILHEIPGYRYSKPEPATAPGTFNLNTTVEGVPADMQVDVLLFSTVSAAVAFLTLPQHVKFSDYPQSLFRIVSSRQLFVGAQGLCAALDGQSAWEFAFPATMVFHGRCEDGLLELSGRPNLKFSQSSDDCVAFATFAVDISAVVGTGVSSDIKVGSPAVAAPAVAGSAATDLVHWT